MRRFFVRYLLISCCTLLSGCLGTRYLKDDEKLLYKQRIKSEQKVNREELTQLYFQRPNRRLPVIPFTPYVWFYYFGQNKYDSAKYLNKIEEIKQHYDSKIEAASEKEKEKKIQKLRRKKRNKIARQNRNLEEGNVWMRWGEPVSVYSAETTGQHIERFNLYYQSKGFFQAQIDTTVRTKGSRAIVTYNIDKGKPYIIDTTYKQTSDSIIYNLLSDTKDQGLLEEGENYEQANLRKERERIDLLLKNNGYFDFSPQYITFAVDTAFNGSGRVAVRTTISNPLNEENHQQFRIENINFITDANVTGVPDSLRKEEEYRGIKYRYFDRKYSKKILNRRVFIEKDSLYNKTNTYDTQNQLANLDVFRFININYDSVGNGLTANIFTSPLSRYQWTNEVGINVTQGFPGPFYNVSFKKRNVFGGLENFEVNGRIGVEGVAPATEIDQIYTSIEGGVNASLIFPQFLIPISGAAKRRLGKINPKTRVQAGYTYTDRPEYSRQNVNYKTSFTWNRKERATFNLTATDVSIINSTLSPSFNDILTGLEQSGNNLINSFRPSFVSNINFSATWNFNSYGINFSNSSFLRLYFESGGTSLNFLNTEFLERENLEFYKYLKLNVDFRKVKPLNANTTFAYRINAGFARPYGENNVLPYEKYFFAGGSNGIRAWRPRRLGPGSYVRRDSIGNSVNYDFEQQGEILIEGSMELRKNLIGFLDYAFFIDFGNVWTFNRDPVRPGAQFKFDQFFEQLAVGSGLGLRFDFSFLVLRLDAGIKIHDPARPAGKRFIFNKGFTDPPFTSTASELVVLNIGIGYPF